jgi:SAM-dependent methyltransferase
MSDYLDDWDSHWASFGDLSAGLNPANRLRERIVLRILGPIYGPVTIADLGSGQGDMAFFLKSQYPLATVVGVEHSAVGVARSRRFAAERGIDVQFIEGDLLSTVPREEVRLIAAEYAVCSEVLEHVDDPVTLLRNARTCLAPKCRLVVTVPGGPRSAFDRHIGHRQHFTPDRLRAVLEDAGYEVLRSTRTGFPFFNLYRLTVIICGRRLAARIDGSDSRGLSRTLSRVMLRIFNGLFHLNLPLGSLGWQVIGVALNPLLPPSNNVVAAHEATDRGILTESEERAAERSEKCINSGSTAVLVGKQGPKAKSVVDEELLAGESRSEQ